MDLTDLLFLSIPAALVVLKLTVLALAAVWVMNTLFRSKGLLPGVRRRMPVHSLRSRTLGS